MKKNNFQLLEDEELSKISFDAQGIKSNVDSTINVFKSITSIIELYVPKVLETILELFKPEGTLKK